MTGVIVVYAVVNLTAATDSTKINRAVQIQQHCYSCVCVGKDDACCHCAGLSAAPTYMQPVLPMDGYLKCMHKGT